VGRGFIMAFNLSGSTITQTGMDSDLSGLSGIAVVTTIIEGDASKPHNTYSIGDRRLVINGTLNHDPASEMLIIGNGTSGASILINLGTYNYGVTSVFSGFTQRSTELGLVITRITNSNFDQPVFDVNGSGTFNWNGGIINTGGTFYFRDSSTVTINDAIINIQNPSGGQLVRSFTTNLNVNGLKKIGGAVLLYVSPSSFEGYEPIHSDLSPQSTGRQDYSLLFYGNSTPITVKDFKGFGNPIDISYIDNGGAKLENPLNGSSTTIGGWLSGSRSDTYIITTKNIDISFVDDQGSIINPKIYAVDENNGNRKNQNSNNDISDKVYESTAVSGTTNIEVISGIYNAVNTQNDIMDVRFTGDVASFKFAEYSRALSGTGVNLKGNGNASVDWILFPDTLITQTIKSTVDAYSTLDNAQELYDRAKANLYDNFEGESEVTIGRVGTLVDGKNLIFTMNQTGTAYNLTGSALTFASPSYVGGFKDATINHGTGTTVFNNMELENSTWNADQLTLIGSADATSVIDIANSGTYNAVDFTFDAASTINNSSGVAIDVIINNGQQQPLTTGSAVNFISAGAVITFNNLSSANVQIVENDNITVSQRNISQTGSLVYNTPNNSNGTWTYIINREGYNPIIGTYDPTGGDLSVDGSQSQKLLTDGSIAYMGSSSVFLSIMPTADGSRMNLRIGDGAVSAANCFDEVEVALMTQDGMTYLANGGGEISIAILPTGSFVFLENNVRLIRDNVGDANATINAFVQSTDGQVLDNTNGGVQFIAPSSDTNIVSVNGVDVTDINDFIADISSIETKVEADARQVLLIAEHDATQVDIAAIPDSVYDDTALVAKVDVLDSNVDDIKTKTDTLVNTDLTGIALSTEIAALNDFDPAIDVVASVTLVDTVTTNTDMRGTDSANTIAPDNASIAAVLVDTNELQLNQGNFATATGFSTPTDVTNSETVIIAEVNANETKIDIIDTNVDAIKLKTDTLVNTDLTGIALSSEIAALNDFDPTLDTVTRVTLVDTTTANTDMRGTDGANTVAPDNASIGSILADTNELQLNQGNFTTATGFSTPTDVNNAQTAIISEVNANETKIDAIETKAQADIRQTALLAQHTATQGLITALNDLSVAEVNAEVDQALVDYDGPTKAELDAVQASIEAAISGLNDLDANAVSQAVWDYLQSATTVSASMKDAVEITLKNAKLIPATI
jgi:hypothetical protein